MPDRWLVLSIDTEEEGTWGRPKIPGRHDAASVENVQRLPRLHEIVDPLGLAPCYLVDYPVVQDPAAVRLLRSLQDAGRCQIGAHLHAWVNPPYDEDVERRPENQYAHRLPRSLERAKLETLTGAIDQAFGQRPTIYRGGRYGFDGESLQILADLGYTADTSVTPCAYFDEFGAPDFLGAPRGPYHPDPADVRRSGDAPLLEVPISMAASRLLPRGLAHALLRAPRALRLGSVLNRLGWVTWLRPSYATLPAMQRLVRRWEADDLPVLNMMFHSSELLPGASPYTPDGQAVERMLSRTRAILEYALERGWRPCRFDELPQRVG